MDGGSWKIGYEAIIPHVNYAICSANFYPPNCRNQKDVFTYLQSLGIANIAITQGEKPIIYQSSTEVGQIDVPKIHSVDTLGAGDIFHGAFCHYILQHSFIDALSLAAQVASHSCLFFGTRKWMEQST
jgi:sugar/nucleoside kinase (ribokinase family)